MPALMKEYDQFKQRYRNDNQRYRGQYGDSIISKNELIFQSIIIVVCINIFPRRLIGVENIPQA